MPKLPKNPLGGITATYTSVQVRFFVKYPGATKERGVIYSRVTVDGQRAPDRSTGISVTTAQWNSKNQCITTPDRESHLLNTRLHKIRSMIYEHQALLERQGETITGRKLLDQVFNQRPNNDTLEEVFELYMSELKATKNRSPRTFQAYEKYFRNVSSFFTSKGHKRPLLDDITKELYQALFVWLKAKYVQDYAVKNAQFLRSLFTYAQANGFIVRNPLTTIRLEKSGHYDTTHLTQEQVNLLAAFDFSTLPLPSESVRVLDEERDVFVFCCFTGLHHADYAQGTYSVQLIKGRQWLTGHRVKSKAGRKDKPYSMPLHPLALAIISKYETVQNLPKRNNSKRNVVLKQIAAYVGLLISELAYKDINCDHERKI